MSHHLHPEEGPMKKSMHSGLFALAVAVVFSFVSAAVAFHCPQDMAKIDAAMQTAQLSDADKAKVMEYRKAGEDAHNAGRHQESVDTLAKAMDILKIK
jgi:hypothetical protein